MDGSRKPITKTKIKTSAEADGASKEKSNTKDKPDKTQRRGNIAELNCILESGGISLSSIRKFIENNASNKKVLLKLGDFKSSIENISKTMVDVAENNAMISRAYADRLINSEDLSTEALDTLCKIKANACSAFFKISNLYESGNEGLIFSSRFCVNDFIKNFYETLYSFYPADLCCNINLRNDLKKSIIVSSNERALQQILMNFIINAHEHSEAVDNRMDIVVQDIECESSVAFAVLDYGIGVDIKNMYKKINHALKTRERDTLFGKQDMCGLLACCRIAEKLGGKILVTNIAGGGSAFILLLKYRKSGNVLTLNDSVSSSCFSQVYVSLALQQLYLYD